MGGAFLDMSVARVCEALDSQVLLVDSSDPQHGYDALFVAREILGDRLIGVVLNRVSHSLLNMVEEMAIPFLTKSGFRILGVLPHDPLLDAITVRQLQELLEGKILCAEDRMEELVANFSVGAMDLDKAMSYFRKLPNKAVITGANRPDLQLAALETATKCLILTGNQSPNEIIVSRARELHVPIIVVPYDTFTTVDRVEHFMGRIRIREQQKVEKARQLLEEARFKAIEAEGKAKSQAYAQTADEGSLQDLSPAGSQYGMVDIFFDYDQSAVRIDAKPVLDQNASIIRNSGDKFQVVVIEGYCDVRGTEEYNLALGQRRAESVSNYLVGLGISPSKVQPISKGETEQFAVGTGEYDYQQNRRAHFVPAVGSPSF